MSLPITQENGLKALCRALATLIGNINCDNPDEVTALLNKLLGDVFGASWSTQWGRFFTVLADEVGPNPPSGHQVLDWNINDPECPDLSDSAAVAELHDKLYVRYEENG
ncbi:MAG: hypothetical protein GY855_07390 [candidate division Zixibacteria bacterium]|nr:hypothetical protein [candidate division Zixibacteria bacterium]